MLLIILFYSKLGSVLAQILRPGAKVSGKYNSLLHLEFALCELLKGHSSYCKEYCKRVDREHLHTLLVDYAGKIVAPIW